MFELPLSFIEALFAAAIVYPLFVPLVKFMAEKLAGRWPIFQGYAALVQAI